MYQTSFSQELLTVAMFLPDVPSNQSFGLVGKMSKLSAN
jgi:hypothetical protein